MRFLAAEVHIIRSRSLTQQLSLVRRVRVRPMERLIQWYDRSKGGTNSGRTIAGQIGRHRTYLQRNSIRSRFPVASAKACTSINMLPRLDQPAFTSEQRHWSGVKWP